MVELIITMIITAITAVTAYTFFVANVNFTRLIEDEIASIRDAKIALLNIRDVVRHADHNNLSVGNMDGAYSDVIRFTLGEPGGPFDTGDIIEYGRNAATNEMGRSVNNGQWEVIARNVNRFSTVFNDAAGVDYDERVDIDLHVTTGARDMEFETSVMVIGAWN